MDDSVHSPRIPGYASVKEAAEMLGLSPRTVYDYIEEGRLPSARLADVIAIPIEEIRKFKPEPSGRPRKNTPLWHISSGDNTQFMSLISVQLHAGQRDVLLQKLEEIRRSLDDVLDWSSAQYEFGQVLMHT